MNFLVMYHELLIRRTKNSLWLVPTIIGLYTYTGSDPITTDASGIDFFRDSHGILRQRCFVDVLLLERIIHGRHGPTVFEGSMVGEMELGPWHFDLHKSFMTNVYRVPGGEILRDPLDSRKKLTFKILQTGFLSLC